MMPLLGLLRARRICEARLKWTLGILGSIEADKIAQAEYIVH